MNMLRKKLGNNSTQNCLKNKVKSLEINLRLPWADVTETLAQKQDRHDSTLHGPSYSRGRKIMV
jgi:hypothetical protein